MPHASVPSSACGIRRQRMKERLQHDPFCPPLHSPTAMLALLNLPTAPRATETITEACLDRLDGDPDNIIVISLSDDDDDEDDEDEHAPLPHDDVEVLVAPSTHWSLPAVDCIHMWRYWFHGDTSGTHAGVPYRLFHVAPDSPRFPTFDAVSYVMSAIVSHSTGTASPTAMSALPRASLDAALTDALPRAYPSRQPTDPIHFFFSVLPHPAFQPTPWQFPALSIRAMWTLWFRGATPSSAVTETTPPLYKLRAREIPDDVSKRRWWSTKQLFAKLTDLALLHPSVSSREMLADGMAENTFRFVCDHVVMTFATECGAGSSLTADSLCTAAAAWATQAPASSAPVQAASHDDGSASPVPASEQDRSIPALSARAMWPLWHRGDAKHPSYKSVPWKKDRVLSATRRVMRTLTDLAVETQQAHDEDALEGLSAAMLLQVFDAVFPVLVSRYDVAQRRLVTPDKKCVNLVRQQYTRRELQPGHEQ